LGVATALIWQRRHIQAIRSAMICFVVLVVMTLLFLPLSIVVQGNPLGLLLMDICGLLLSLLLAWIYRRVTPPGFMVARPSLAQNLVLVSEHFSHPLIDPAAHTDEFAAAAIFPLLKA
jgi:tryptophan-rich sensory protein